MMSGTCPGLHRTAPYHSTLLVSNIGDVQMDLGWVSGGRGNKGHGM